MEGLVGVPDAVGVVVEAEVAPRDEEDEVAVLRVGTRGAVVVELAREIGDLSRPLNSSRVSVIGSMRTKSRVAAVSSPIVTSTEASRESNRTTVPSTLSSVDDSGADAVAEGVVVASVLWLGDEVGVCSAAGSPVQPASRTAANNPVARGRVLFFIVMGSFVSGGYCAVYAPSTGRATPVT